MFGKLLKGHRKKTGKSLKAVGKDIGINYSYLSKIEKGIQRPSVELLNKLVTYYKLNNSQTGKIFHFAGYKREEVTMNNQSQFNKSNQNKTQISIDPKNNQILYTDHIHVTSSPFGLVLDIGQKMGPTTKAFIVSRIGMSAEHAKALVNLLNRALKVKNIKKSTTKAEA